MAFVNYSSAVISFNGNENPLRMGNDRVRIPDFRHYVYVSWKQIAMYYTCLFKFFISKLSVNEDNGFKILADTKIRNAH